MRTFRIFTASFLFSSLIGLMVKAQDAPPEMIESVTVSVGDSALLKSLKPECKVNVLARLNEEARLNKQPVNYCILKSLTFTSEDNQFVGHDMHKILEFTYVGRVIKQTKDYKVNKVLTGKGVVRYIIVDGQKIKFHKIELLN